MIENPSTYCEVFHGCRKNIYSLVKIWRNPFHPGNPDYC